MQIDIIESQNKAGWSAPLYAVLNEFDALLIKLKQLFPDILLDISAPDGTTPLFLAVALKNWNLVRMFLPLAKPKHFEVENPSGWLLQLFYETAPAELIEESVLLGATNPEAMDYSNKLALEFIPAEIRERQVALARALRFPAAPVELIDRVT